MTLTEMKIKIGADNSPIKLAIYADDNGSIGSFLRGTEEKTSTQWYWNTFTLTSPLNVTAGNYYWLAVWTEHGYNCAYDSGGIHAIKEYPYGGDWPATISGVTYEDHKLCIYAQ